MIAYDRDCTAGLAGDVFCDIAVVNPDGSSKRVVARRRSDVLAGPVDDLPVWLPNPNRIVAVEWGYATSVRVVDVNTLAVRRISKQPWNDVLASRGGSRIVFTTLDAKARLVLHYATTTGKVLAQKRLAVPGYLDPDLWVDF